MILTEEEELSEFLRLFPYPLHHRRSYIIDVFWRSLSDNNNSSPDSGTAGVIQEKIKSALGYLRCPHYFLAQLWAPVTLIDGRQVLSTSGQPFAVNNLIKEFSMYRLYSDKYMYNIDEDQNKNNKLDIEEHMTITSGGPATAFLNRFPSVIKPVEGRFPRVKSSFMLPICLPSQTSSCIGVLEITTMGCSYGDLQYFVSGIVEAVKRADLDVFYAKDRIPYKTINRLKHAKEDIQDALKIVCESHNISLAQVWIDYVEEDHVPFSSLEDTRTKHFLPLKLTGFYARTETEIISYFNEYSIFCDVTPRAGLVEEFALEILQDYESRYSPCKHYEPDYGSISALEICLRGNDTGECCNYVFEFLWIKLSNPVVNLLEALLLTLKKRLPRFKFASGAELGDELDVIVIGNNTDGENDEMGEISETKKLKIFQGKESSSMPKASDKGKQLAVMNGEKWPRTEGRPKNAPIKLSIEEVEEQFGKTMEDAAKALGVSRCTLRRWWNKHTEESRQSWQGPKQMKGSKTNEKVDNRAFEEPSDRNIN